MRALALLLLLPLCVLALPARAQNPIHRCVDTHGNPVFTGCAAWGLERLVLACFSQHGFDKARWPESLRADVWS